MHRKIDGPPGNARRAIDYFICVLLPERHARTDANVVAAGQDAAVKVVAEESFQSPVVTRLRDTRADAAIQRQLVLGRRPGRADDADAQTRSEIKSLTRGARAHRFQKVHVGAENQEVAAALTQVRQRQAWLDVHLCADEANPHIDGSAGLERAAIGLAPTSNVTERGAQIEAELVLGTAHARRRAATLRVGRR